MNELKHLAEFREELQNYKISDTSKQLLAKVKLVLLAGSSSSGRNTIIRELLKTNNYHYIVSDTTRKPRVNDQVLEQDGVVYWFRSEEDVLDDLRDGKFLEAALIHNQQVSGISLRELQTALSHNKIAITDVEMAGIDNISHAKPDTIAIFVAPPSFDEWQRRLTARGTMDETEYKRRLETAIVEFEHALKTTYYQFVLNDNLAKASEQIDQLAHGSQMPEEKQKQNRIVVQSILDSTKKHLLSLSTEA